MIVLYKRKLKFQRKGLRKVACVNKSENFHFLLRKLEKWRTYAPKWFVPPLLLEDILTGKKPHELLPPEASIYAIAGVLLILGGVWLRGWAWGFHNHEELYTRGPYAIIRHPLYLGSFMAMIGILLIFNHWLNWVLGLSFFGLFYTATIITEEIKLKEKYGEEWKKYITKIPVLIPIPWKHLRLEDLSGWRLGVFLGTNRLRSILYMLAAPIMVELIEEIAF